MNFGGRTLHSEEQGLWARPTTRPAAWAPDHPWIRAIFAMLMTAGPNAAKAGWKETPDGLALGVRINAAQTRLYVEAAGAEVASTILTRGGPLSLDLATVLLTQPREGGAYRARLVRGNEILEAKGCRRWGGERRALLAQLATELEMLRALKAGPERMSLFPVQVLDPVACDFIYEPADWLRQLAQDAPKVDLHPQILRFDHRANRAADVLAKKLAIHLSFSTSARGSAVHSVGALLHAIGVPRDELASRQGRGGRLADRFEEALLRLQDCGLFRVRYRSSALERAGADRVKGWVAQWLQTELVASVLAPSNFAPDALPSESRSFVPRHDSDHRAAELQDYR